METYRNISIERVSVASTTNTTDHVLKSIPAGSKFVVTELFASVAGTATADAGVLFEFDGASDTRISEHPGIAAGSGFVEGNGGGPIAVGGDGQDLLVTISGTPAGTVVAHATGYVVQS